MDRGLHPTQAPLRTGPFTVSSALERILGAAPPATPRAGLIGLEHEYSLLADGVRVDFRELIHDLAVDGHRLDPGDRNAYRLPSGLVLTCDAEDAEVVSPPVPVQAGFIAELEAWAAEGRAELSTVLPPGLEVVPFSTHLSASMPDEVAGPACALFALTFAPALMLVLDGPGSSGVFVRPRPGRLELCGEHAGGARLRAAAALVAGGARACARDGGGLPPRLAVDLRPATGRYGLFVGRHLAFGFDFYAAPRTAALPLAGGGTITAQDYLEATWQVVRAALGADAGADDLAAGDAMVAARLPLGVEGGDRAETVAPRRPSPSPFGAVLGLRHRPGFDVTAEAATWDFTVLRIRGRLRDAFASVPAASLDDFLRHLDAGRLDDLLLGYLDATSAGRVLDARHQAMVPDLWDEAVIGPDLLPYERSTADPGSPLVAPEQPAPAPEPAVRAARERRRRPGRAWALAALLALVVAGVAAALLGALSGDEPATVEIGAGAPVPTAITSTTVLPTTATPAPAITVPPTTTIASTAPATTTPAVVTTQTVATTAAPPTSTSTSSSSTTSTVAAPSQLLVAVTPTALGCGFTPPSATGVRGSSIRFRNDTPTSVNLTVTPPAGAPTTISLEQGSTSVAVPLVAAGAHTVTCTQGDAGLPGRLTVTVSA